MLPKSQPKHLQSCFAWLNWNKSFLYTNTFLSTPDIQHPVAPIIFHYFLPFFDLLLCSPTNFSVFVLFLFPKMRKIMLLHPLPSFTNSLLLTVASISDQQQGRLTYSEFLDFPLIQSIHSSDTVNFSQTIEPSKYVKVLSCPIYLKLSNISTRHKLPKVNTMSDKISHKISHILLIDVEIYLKYWGVFVQDSYFFFLVAGMGLLESCA